MGAVKVTDDIIFWQISVNNVETGERHKYTYNERLIGKGHFRWQ